MGRLPLRRVILQKFSRTPALDKVAIFNLLILPGVTENGILSEAAAFCEKKLAFLIIDPPFISAADDFGGKLTTKIRKRSKVFWGVDFVPPVEKNASIFSPTFVRTRPRDRGDIELPPAGTVAGIFGRTDLNRGVWKAPAGLQTSILNSPGVVERGKMTDQQQGVLNPLGVNCLREFTGSGTVVLVLEPWLPQSGIK